MLSRIRSSILVLSAEVNGLRDAEKARLIEAAKRASGRAYCPYSKFAVGAAVLDSDDSIYTGCNVENASYGLTMCAERVALFTAVANGASPIKALALFASTSRPPTPCGACRQVIHELAPEATIVMVGQDGRSLALKSDELLPLGFDASDLPSESRLEV